MLDTRIRMGKNAFWKDGQKWNICTREKQLKDGKPLIILIKEEAKCQTMFQVTTKLQEKDKN